MTFYDKLQKNLNNQRLRIPKYTSSRLLRNFPQQCPYYILECISVTFATGHILTYFKFPHVTWGSNIQGLSNKTMFTSLVRTTGPYSEAGQLIVTLFKEFNWYIGGLLYVDTGKSTFWAGQVFCRFHRKHEVTGHVFPSLSVFFSLHR